MYNIWYRLSDMLSVVNISLQLYGNIMCILPSCFNNYIMINIPVELCECVCSVLIYSPVSKYITFEDKNNAVKIFKFFSLL